MGWIHEQNKMTDEIGQLKIKNRDLEAELEKHQWIPVEEGLPRGDGHYLVADSGWYGRMWFDGKEWCFGNKQKYPYANHITHWMPIILPKK